MTNEVSWWFIIGRLIFQTFIVYAGMLILVYIVGNIIVKLYTCSMRFYRKLYGPVRNEAQSESDESRMHRLQDSQNTGGGDNVNPAENEKDE